MKFNVRKLVIAIALTVFGVSAVQPASAATYTIAPPAYPCVAPPVLSSGYWARTGLSWLGQKWGNNTGGTWNKVVQPYAVCTGVNSDYLRFELHDTPNDHGLTDPSFKRRAEIGSNGVYHNGIVYQIGFSFRTTWANPTQTSQESTEMQVHWPSGASPAYSLRVVSYKGGMGLRVTVKNDRSSNTTLVTVPLTDGVPHDAVIILKLGSGSFERTYLDGQLISDYSGQFGSLKEDGYSQRFGPYGAALRGNTVVEEFKNLSILSTADLTARVKQAPAW